MCGSDCIRREWMVKEVNAVKCQQCDFGMVPSHHAPLSWSLHTLDCSIIVKPRQGSAKDRQGMAVKAKGLKA